LGNKNTHLTTDTYQSFNEIMKLQSDKFKKISIIDEIEPSKGVTI